MLSINFKYCPGLQNYEKLENSCNMAKRSQFLLTGAYHISGADYKMISLIAVSEG